MMSSASALVHLSECGLSSVGSEVQVTRALVLETSAWIAFRCDRSEVARRAFCGLGSVVAWDLLDTLMDLPAGLPVPAAELGQAARGLVYRAPPGVARLDDCQVIRDLVPALTPVLAMVTARDWAEGLMRASRFAPYCRRMVVSSGRPPGAKVLQTAARHGIGVGVRNGTTAEMLQDPQPVADWQPTTAWWRFCEVVYGHAAQALG
jgi:hypothetical protein